MPKETRGRRRPTSSPLAGTKAIVVAPRRAQRMQVFPSSSVMRKMMPETKYFDTFFSQSVDASADWATTVVAMTSYMNADGSTVSAYTDGALIPSAIGSGYGQVVGNKYVLKKLKCRGEVVPAVVSDAADMTSPTTVRVVLVQDTQPNGAQATGNQLFTDWGSNSQCNYSYQSISSGNGGRFRVLYDRIYQLQPAVAGTDGANTNSVMNNAVKFSFVKTWKNGLKTVIKSGASTPAVASLSDNNIYLLAHAGGGATCTIRGNARASYSD